jgi:predicted nucleotidyltransferase
MTGHDKPRHPLDVARLGKTLSEKASEIDFAFLFGSCRDGFVKQGSDIDVAVFVNRNVKINIDLVSKLCSIVEDSSGNHAECDLSTLNDAGPILRFNVICGKLLFVRPEHLEKYAEFFSVSCREYEETMAMYQRHNLRLNGRNGDASNLPRSTPGDLGMFHAQNGSPR